MALQFLNLLERFSHATQFTDLKQKGECPLESVDVITVLKFHAEFRRSAGDINSCEILHKLCIAKRGVNWSYPLDIYRD